jgi:hypothetical protein
MIHDRRKGLDRNELTERIRQANKRLGDFGENVVADYMHHEGWTQIYPDTLGLAMVAIGAQKNVRESPERFLDRGFWRYVDDSVDDREAEQEWELIQVKTTCVESSLSWVSICWSAHRLEHALRYTERAISMIDYPGLSCPFPQRTKFQLYMVIPDGILSIDIIDIQKYSRRTNRSDILHIDRYACETVCNFDPDDHHRYVTICDERRHLQKQKARLERNPKQIELGV